MCRQFFFFEKLNFWKNGFVGVCGQNGKSYGVLSCGQGFDEYNNLVGIAIPSHKCADGKHDGPIARINISASGNVKP